jgi:putative ABC transport system ATP-binding protein
MIIKMKLVTKVYRTGAVEFAALKQINLGVEKGQMVAVVGPSGSGKSTLMNIIGCLDVPTSGVYQLEGENVNRLSANQLADIRNRKIGFVFQAFNLLPYATAYENVEVPLLFARVNAKGRRERVVRMLEQVGLGEKLGNKPTEMSGGEMQRVAIARALANDPEIILADEPTGNLDTKSGEGIVKIFHDLHALGKTVLIITHDLNLARRAQRIVKLKDGMIETDEQAVKVA